MTPWLAFVLLLSVAACTKNLSDADLLSYASRAFDKGKMQGKHIVLGNHQGVPVVADYPCADLCPAHTVRVIHYDVGGESDCRRVGGTPRTLWVPEGIGNAPKLFCLPKVLADHSVLARRWPGGEVNEDSIL